MKFTAVNEIEQIERKIKDTKRFAGVILGVMALSMVALMAVAVCGSLN